MTARNLVYDKGVEPVPGYRLTDFLGGGSFGEVWKAIDLSTGRHFALKIIDLSYSTSALKELRALKLVMNLNHPNLVPLMKAWLKDKHGQSLDLHAVDLVKQKGKLKLLLILMGLGEKSLSARLKEVNRAAAAGGADPDDDERQAVGIPPDELTNYMRGAAKGIDYLNAVRHEGVDPASDGPIVHCDIKPDNMMIVAGTEVQIADCGVAVSLNQDTRKTVSAAFSPVYAPPELATNKPSTGTDQYSLAISYYELRTGLRPFAEGMNQLEMMTAHSLGDLDFSSPTLTAGERQVLKWATSPRIAERYPSCFDMVKQLERGIEGLPPRAPGELQKSVASIQVPPPRPAGGSSPRVFVPGGSNHDQTLAHHVDLFTPPPASAKGSEPYVGVPAGTGSRPDAAPPAPPGSRPGILIDRDDPMGGEMAAPELDPEIAAIIRGSQIVATPSRRLPPDESRPAQRPAAPVAVPVTDGLSATKFSVETDVPQVVELVATTAPVETAPEVRKGRRPAPSRAYDGTIVPGRAERDPAADDKPRRADAKPKKSPSWNGQQQAGKKSSAPMIGVAVGAVILAVGGVAAFLMLPGKDPITVASSAATTSLPTTNIPPVPVPPPTKPDGVSPPTGVTAPTTQVPPPTVHGNPVMTEQQRFAQQLESLKPPFVDNANLDSLLDLSDKNADRRSQLMTVLLGSGKDAQRLADLAAFATAKGKWLDFDRRDELAEAWYKVNIQTVADEAVTCVQGTPTPEDATKKLADLRKALGSPVAKEVRKYSPGVMQAAIKLDNVAIARSKAGVALQAFGELLLKEEPPGGKFFAAEYFKLARAADLPIAELRDFRNKTNAWSGIDSSYQSALADHVVKALSVEKPDWAAISKTCDNDQANGWKTLAEADRVVMNAGDNSATLPKIPTPLDSTGTLFVKYLQSCAKQNIDALVDLYKGGELPPLLAVKARKSLAANIIVRNTTLLKIHREWSKQPVELFFANPYDGERQLATIGARLETSARLLGALGPTERIHRYLISAALGAGDKAAVAGLQIDEDSLADEDIAATLACYKLMADDKSLTDKVRTAAAARAARLAFKRIDLSFFDCDTDAKVLDREISIAKLIGASVSEHLAAGVQSGQPADITSLKFSELKAKIITKDIKAPDRFPKLRQILTQLRDAPDEPACLAMCAYYRLLDVYMKDLADTAVWDDVKRDAKESLRIYPLGYAASVVMCIVQCGEYKYKNHPVYVFPAPANREITTDKEIEQAIKRFRDTRAVLRTRKSSALNKMQTNFLDLRVIQLRDADPEDKTAKALELERIKISPLEDIQAPPDKK